MPMAVALPLIMGIGGAVTGALGNTKSARTGTQSGNRSSTTRPSFSPVQTELQGTIGKTLNDYLTTGPDLTPLETSGTDAINKSYKAIGDRLKQSLASRGFGNSGASGEADLATELGRAGSIGNLESHLKGTALQQMLQALGLGNSFAFAAPTYSTNESSSGDYTQPGSAAAGALGGGLGDFLLASIAEHPEGIGTGGGFL